MATPGELVETMAEALGISAATVTQYDRVLAEAGLRSKSGRGNSAAKITARDAANLLIAILAAPLEGAVVREAARTCRVYGGMPLLPRASDPKAFRAFGLPRLKTLAPDHTLADAIETLILGVAEGEVFKIPVRGGRALTGDFPFKFRVDSPRPWADMSCSDVNDERYARVVYFDPSTLTERHRPHDLSQSRRASFLPIRKLGELLASNDKRKPKIGGRRS